MDYFTYLATGLYNGPTMKHFIKQLFFLSSILISPVVLGAQIDKNIVIIESIESYNLIPDKKGESISHIKRSVTNQFMATRAPGTAFDYVFYDNFTKVDKANVKASGVKPVYQSSIQADIFYDDSKICAVNVPLVEINKPVSTHFELTYNRPEFEPLLFIGCRYPIKHKVITITMPITLKDRFDVVASNIGNNISITRSESKNGKDWVITLTGNNLEPLESPSDAPPARYIFPTLQFVGQYANPDELYRRLRTFTLQPDPNLATVENKTKEITDSCRDDISKIKAIYKWVHTNIRYVAIEHGDLGSTPDHASEVLTKRYGDCKGSANLLKAMLRSIGLDARLVWIGTVDIPDDYTSMPTFSTGDHMIAAIKFHGDSIVYLDGTTGLSDYGYYSSSIQGKQTLIEDDDEHCIIGRVPVLPPCNNSRITNLNLSIDGTSLKGSMHSSISGQYKSALINRLHDSKPDERKQIVERYATSNRKSWNITNPILTNADADGGPTKLSCDVSIERSVKQVGDKTYLTVDFTPNLSSFIFDTKDRHYGGWLNNRSHISNNIIITYDSATVTPSLPKSISIDNEWITASVNYDATATAITATLSLTINKNYIPLSSLEAYNNDLKQIIRATTSAIVLNAVQ